MLRSISGLPVANRRLILLTFTFALLCCIPALLMSGGMDFGSHTQPFSAMGEATNHPVFMHRLFDLMHGAFVHSILEWSAFCVALMIALFALLHYNLNGWTITPVISLVLLSAGTMDAFHVLAADRLIPAVADNHQFIPFTWALSRMFNALITIVGVGLLIFTDEVKQRRHTGLILAASLLFASIGSALVLLCARLEVLPQSYFPNQLITRPWDVPPLVLFVFAALVVIPSALQKHRNVFLLSIWISMIPQIATQLYMSFGSRDLFDSAFNVAHVIKIMAYLMPLAGLVIDYIIMHRQLEHSIRHITRTRRKLHKTHGYLQAVLGNIGDAVLTVNSRGDIKSANRATEQLFGYCTRQLSHMNLADLIEQIPMPFYSICERLAGESLQWQPAYTFEATGRHQLLHRYDLEVSVNRLRVQNPSDYVVSIHDCTLIKQVTQELESTKGQVHLAAEARQRLLSNVSFELRTPLNAVIGFAALLEEQLHDLHMNDLVADASEIRMAGAHLQEMINEMLDLATLNGGRLDVVMQKTCLKQLCTDVVQAMQGIVEASNHIMHLHCPDDMVSIRTDPQRLRQILFNLVSNAARLTQDSRIDLYVQQTDYQQRPGVEIRIVIAGVNLTQAQQQLIFDIFGNTSEPTHPAMGSGTGLSLSHRMVSLLGGHTDLTCDEQLGTIFQLQLPIDGPELDPVQLDEPGDPSDRKVFANDP